MDGEGSPPPSAAALGELFAERLGASSGHWQIELWLEDGRIRKWMCQEIGGRTDLGRFDEAPEAE